MKPNVTRTRYWRLLPLIFLLLGLAPIFADDDADTAPAPPAAPVTDPAEVARHYHQVLSRPQYSETGEPDINTRVEDWLSQWFRRFGTRIGDLQFANRMRAFESLLMSLMVVFSIAVLLYIAVRLTRRRAGMDEEPSRALPKSNMFRPPESYDREIEGAVGSGDWHAAWLAAWRQFLARLEHRHLVEADRTRTNREYLAQLRAQSPPASALALVAGMVDAYDRFIYGRKNISRSDWDLFRRQMGEAGLLLHLEERLATAPPQPAAS